MHDPMNAIPTMQILGICGKREVVEIVGLPRLHGLFAFKLLHLPSV
jgi:hypothetical protein